MTTAVHNSEIADKLLHLADLLEIDGANKFRVRAYRRAAQQIGSLPREAADMIAAGEDLSKIHGIGEDLAGKIAEIVRTGHLGLLDQMTARFPLGLSEIVALPGIGPKRAKQLYDAFKVKSLDELEDVLRSGKAEQLQGFGKTVAERLLREIEQKETAPQRFKLNDAERIAEPLRQYLAAQPGVHQVIIAGSYRRRSETVGDIDMLVTGDAGCGEDLAKAFTSYPAVETVIASGAARSTVILKGGLHADLRFIEPESFGAALLYFTGSQAHTIALRTLAVKSDLKMNEYGLFRGRERLASHTEEDMYQVLGMAFIPPELREDRGEIDAARAGRLPRLIELSDIRGDLHAHTTDSDGRLSLEDMVEAARAKGYGYLAITDHSKRVSIANGLDERRLEEQIEQIDRLAERYTDIRILKSCEVDILSDGSLDIADETLKGLDFVYGAVHYNFALSRDAQTERIIRAMDNPYLSILAHPTGRIINRRRPFEVDMERVIRAAADRGCAIEINAQPDRLDMTDIHCRMARDEGVKIAISSDAHSAQDLDNMRFGVGQARRGWLEAKDVLNTRPWPELKDMLRRS